MRTITLASGQTYIEDSEQSNLIPAHIWLENQAAMYEIGSAFELLYGERHSPRFRGFLYWLLGQLREKYGDRWLRLLEAYLESPEAEKLILEMEIGDFLRNQGNGTEVENES